MANPIGFWTHHVLNIESRLPKLSFELLPALSEELEQAAQKAHDLQTVQRRILPQAVVDKIPQLRQQITTRLDAGIKELLQKTDDLVKKAAAAKPDTVLEQKGLFERQIDKILPKVSGTHKSDLEIAEKNLGKVIALLKIPKTSTDLVSISYKGHLFAEKRNMYDGVFDRINFSAYEHPSASTAIVLDAINQSLTKRTRNFDFATSLTKGHESFFDYFSTKKQTPNFAALLSKFSLIGQKEPSSPPSEIKKEKDVRTKEFLDLLTSAQDAVPIGFVVERDGKSFALLIFKNEAVSFVDPHGFAAISENAYRLDFNSCSDAAQFLSQRFPFIEREQDYINAFGNAHNQLTLKGIYECRTALTQADELTDEEQAIMRQNLTELSQAVEQGHLDNIRRLSDALHPNYRNLLYFYMYAHHKHLGKEKPHLEYGKVAFRNLEEGGVQYEASKEERQEVVKRLQTRLVLKGIYDALRTVDMGAVKQLHDLFQTINPDKCSLLHRMIYEMSVLNNQGIAKSAKDLIRINHADFGRVSFRDEEGFSVPISIKAEAVKELTRELIVNWEIT